MLTIEKVVAVVGAVLVVAKCGGVVATGSPEVQCTRDRMTVSVPMDDNTKTVYLQGLRDYPDPACRPHTDPAGKVAVFDLDLEDVYRCAVTRVFNKQTGKKIYYQTIVIEKMQTESEPATNQTLQVKCAVYKDHLVTKRQVFPAGFEEPTDIEITTSLVGMAPPPNITVGVRQAGKLVTGELNVSPGTPLQMEISLDQASTPVYGLLVTHMQVSDTKTQEETIIFNGCSADPYLFENFRTVDGDNLIAKFRAFKFPDSTYVQFKGTVNVCLDRCKGVECSDGSIGYGRRKRAIPTLPADPNKIFEVTITSFIKVNYDDENENSVDAVRNNETSKKSYREKKLIVDNQRSERTDDDGDDDDDIRFRNVDDERATPETYFAELREKNVYRSIVAAENSASPANLYGTISVLLGGLLHLWLL